MKRSDVYKLIDGEREYQNLRWKDMQPGARKHSPAEWILYMEYYLNEAKRIASTTEGEQYYKGSMEFIRKVTALGVAAMEENETNPRVYAGKEL